MGVVVVAVAMVAVVVTVALFGLCFFFLSFFLSLMGFVAGCDGEFLGRLCV